MEKEAFLTGSVINAADSDEAGHAFQFEACRLHAQAAAFFVGMRVEFRNWFRLATRYSR
jgi:hypothetical protein